MCRQAHSLRRPTRSSRYLRRGITRCFRDVCAKLRNESLAALGPAYKQFRLGSSQPSRAGGAPPTETRELILADLKEVARSTHRPSMAEELAIRTCSSLLASSPAEASPKSVKKPGAPAVGPTVLPATDILKSGRPTCAADVLRSGQCVTQKIWRRKVSAPAYGGMSERETLNSYRWENPWAL